MTKWAWRGAAAGRCARAVALGGLVLAGALWGATARAQTPAEFYRGKTVTLFVSAAAGGGYDALARLVAKHMVAFIPGKPDITVKNMPGAGGIIAVNYIANTAAKDGTVFGAVQANTAFEPLYGAKAAEYDATKLNWLGTPSVETGLLVVRAGHPAQTIQDAMRMPIKAGVSGANSGPALFAQLLNETLGTKIETVVGYRGQNGAFEAMEKGQIDAYGLTYWSALTSTRKKWLLDKKIRILVQFGPEREQALASTPWATDLIKDSDKKALFEAAYAQLAIGRPFVMAAGVPADRVAAMRQALADTFADAKFRRDADRGGLVINKPRTGEQLQQQIAQAYRAPPDVVLRLRQVANPTRR